MDELSQKGRLPKEPKVLFAFFLHLSYNRRKHKIPGIADAGPFCVSRHVYLERNGKTDMYIIAGLGNPTKEYEKTRHNAGFDTMDILADKLGVSIQERKHKALCAKGIIGGEKVLLMKPQTFMNLSGESIRDAADFYKVDPGHIIILYDDISLEVGQLRIRGKGSAGGHNGIKSIIAHLGTQEFPRVKIGVGAKPDRMDLADYVLSRFSQTDRSVMEDAFHEAADAAQMIILEGCAAAMNRYNGGRKQCRTL